MGRTGLVLALALGSAGAATADEPVRVYTNADLEPLPAVESSDPPPSDTGPGWQFVIDFLAEQHARIDADRAYELDSAVLDEAARGSTENPRYVLPWGYGYPYGYAPHGYVSGRACPKQRPANAAARDARPLPGPRDLVVPLHARRPIRAR